jgi:hypothetical protein
MEEGKQHHARVLAGAAPIIHLNAGKMHIPSVKGMSMGYFSYLHFIFMTVWQACQRYGIRWQKDAQRIDVRGGFAVAEAVLYHN